ncbi:efflux RND transporter periplasmic adaptor subunit [Zhouia amylolytica]|uniref:efflux RND transporter periplasmic adaptor subunit n=1 Tax=Zhouia amylolytica TaxID=376730 RepID=UPI0020CC840D|nr:efflux RND transporter periplasmic adaptor subunit [Zhouia amylolytica]MCQ0112076.1 efflux RND transporter periplasmic adaptor subunit [Zhouia amylolytica]
MDKIIDKKSQRTNKLKRLKVPMGIGGVVIFLLIGLPQFFRASLERDAVIIETVKRGSVANTLSAEGIVEPFGEVVLVSPATAKIKSVFREAGAVIDSGQAILQLDAEFMAREYKRLEDELKLKDNNVQKLRLELQKNLRQIKLENEIKELQVKNFIAAVDRMERLYEIGGATKEALNESKQNLEIARLEKEKLQSEYEYKKASFGQELANESILSSIQRQKLEELGKKLEDASLKAQQAGMLTWVEKRIGVQVQEGEPLAKIANVSSFILTARISDRYMQQLQIGLPVLVTVNSEVAKGEIDQISPTVENNAVNFKVRLEANSQDMLKPNLSVPVSVVIGNKENTLFLPDGAAFKGAKTQKVFVLNDDKAIAKEVELGIQADGKVEILSGLEEGDQVIISDMENYKNKSKVNIR